VCDGELGEQVALGLGELGGLPEGTCRAGERAEAEQVELVGDLGQVVPAAVSAILSRSKI
jgi:hypothetical protein